MRPYRQGRWHLRLVAAIALAFVPGAVLGAAGTCDDVARQAAQESGVPFDVLRAIALTETGRGRDGEATAWPWTVNMEGVGRWFDTRAEALAYARDHRDRGARSFDLGCFQINHRWHGENFASLDAMIDPLANARYAARFLADLHAESGDWSIAAGAYHSRTETFARRYRARFDAFRMAGGGAPAGAPLTMARAEVPRANLYPLLQATAAPRAIGSLVPQTGAATPFIGASARALR